MDEVALASALANGGIRERGLMLSGSNAIGKPAIRNQKLLPDTPHRVGYVEARELWCHSR